MELGFAEQKVRWDLLEWGQQHTLAVQLRCMAIALDLTRLAIEPGNLKLRRETMTRIARLEEEVRTQNAGLTLGSCSRNDKAPLQKEQRVPLLGQIASPVSAASLVSEPGQKTG